MTGREGREKKTYLDHIRSDKANTTSPALRRVIKHIVNSDPLVARSQSVQLVLEQDILGVDIRKDEVDFGVVAARTTAHNRLCDLQHWGDARAAGDHTETLDHVGGVGHGALGAADFHLVPDLHLGEALADVACGVALDEEVKVAGGRVIGDGGVGAEDLFLGGGAGLGVGDGEGGGEGDVLAGWETED